MVPRPGEGRKTATGFETKALWNGATARHHAVPAPFHPATYVSQKPPLTELQLAILSVLWENGQATSAQVRSGLEPDRSLALTTVTTLLGRLEKKGVVAHERDGRRYLYRATVPRDRVQHDMVTDLTRSLFDGDFASLAAHLLETRRLNGDQRARLLALLDGDGRKRG